MWNDEQSEQLVKLWNEGLSASKVAEAMRTTRNCVIGRIHRLKAAGIEVKTHIQPPSKRRQRRLARLKVANRSPDRIIQLVKPCKPPKALPDTLEGSVPLLEVTGCRWPVTPGPPHRFCNKTPMEERPYCDGHMVRAIQPRVEKLGKGKIYLGKTS